MSVKREFVRRTRRVANIEMLSECRVQNGDVVVAVSLILNFELFVIFLL